MKLASRTVPYALIAAFILLILSVGVVPAFSPPQSVPYNAAAYADRAKLRNFTGRTSLGTYASPAACPAQVNLFSQNVTYSVPVLSLLGRGGLGVNLTLAYNSKVWIKSGSTIYFDGDNGWPAPGWRLGFGRIDGVYTDASYVDHYYLISGDGSVRDLRYNSGSGKYESTDSSYIDFDDSTGILRMKDGTQITYASSGGFVQPTQIKDRNGNYITISYTGTGQQVSSIVDTLGRTISFSYTSGYLTSISKSGFGGGSRTWSFGYTDVQLSYSFGSGLTVNGPSSGSYVKLLTSITYPNSTQQVFSYNGYAQMTEAAFKSSSDTLRGKVLVTWQSAPGGGWTDSPTPSQVGNYDGSNGNYWSLSFSSYSTTVTDPASVSRTSTFYSTPSWADGLPYQSQIPSSSTQRTSVTEWSDDGNSMNPRVTRVTTTLNDTSQVSKAEYDYTSYGNVSEVREYDYGSGSAGSLKRKTTTSYVTDSSYTSRHILGLPTTTIVYDGGGTAKSRTVLAYDEGTLTSATGASNHDDTNYGTSFTYRGLVTTTTRYTNASAPSGAISNTYSYDMLGNLRTESADCCIQKQYNYSSTTQYSQPDSVVRGSGTTLSTSATYDGYTSLPASSTDENNKTTSYSHDSMNRPTTTTRSDNTQFTTSYDDAAAAPSSTSTTPIETNKSIKQKTETDGLGRSTRRITMDNSNNVIAKVDTVYDSVGRPWKVSNPYDSGSASDWTETQYDSLGRVTKVIPPDGSSSSNYIGYSYSGNAVTVTDQAGKQRQTKTDALGRMVEVTEPDPDNSDSLSLVTTYTYDPMNNLTEISQGSQTRTYVFDGLSRKTSETTPEAGTVSYTYNSDGLLTGRTDARGVDTTYTYDSTLNRLTQISYDVSGTTATTTSSVSYTYGTDAGSNNKGRLTQMTDGVGQENYTYDSLGRVTQVQKKIYNVTYTTSYTYNLAGEVVNMTYPSGRVVSHTYDVIGRPTAAGGYATSATYNTSSQVTGLSYGNGVGASYTYSGSRRQLSGLSYTKSGNKLLELAYHYKYDASNCSTGASGNNGQIQCVKDTTGTEQAGRTEKYTYDSLHRLKTAQTTGSTSFPQWGLSWTYDRYGNRTAQSVTAGSAPSNSVSVSTSTNQITGMGQYNFYYDSSGNLTQDDVYKYKYDAENRMVELRDLSDTLIATYAFDGNSLRVVKVVGGDRTFYIYAGSQMVEEYEDAASNNYNSGTTPGQAPSEDTSTLIYQHADHLTTRLTTENDSDQANEQAHYPFGESWYSGGTADPSVERKFTSYMKDDEASTGRLNYAVFREHSARIGRFQMADPKQGWGNPQKLNRYAYVANNPTNKVDPRGLDDLTLGQLVPCGHNGEGNPGCVPWHIYQQILHHPIQMEAPNLADAFGKVGGWVGGAEAWQQLQWSYTAEINNIPMGCWVGGFRDPACVEATERGDPAPPTPGGPPFSQPLAGSWWGRWRCMVDAAACAIDAAKDLGCDAKTVVAAGVMASRCVWVCAATAGAACAECWAGVGPISGIFWAGCNLVQNAGYGWCAVKFAACLAADAATSH